MSESCFGTVNIRRPEPSTAGAWWFTAPRESFTSLCERMYADHMKNSYGDRIVSGKVVVGYCDVAPRAKGLR